MTRKNYLENYIVSQFLIVSAPYEVRLKFI